MPKPSDPILKHSRREALVAIAIWLVAMTYTVGFCVLFGFQPQVGELRFIFGLPAWAAWGIVAPWAVMIAVAAWFAFGFMTDDSLE